MSEPQEITLYGRKVPVAVLDQYAAAIVSGLTANEAALRELNDECLLTHSTMAMTLAQRCLGTALALIKMRAIILYPEPYGAGTTQPPKENEP